MKSIFSVPMQKNLSSIFLLLIRIVAGYAFILHGWGKIQNPFGWMSGGPFPGFLQALAAVAEFGGGIGLILGLLFPLVNLSLIITMITAAIFHGVILGHPFVGQGGPSYEPAISYVLIFLLLWITGPGKFSIDYKLFGEKLR